MKSVKGIMNSAIGVEGHEHAKQLCSRIELNKAHLRTPQATTLYLNCIRDLETGNIDEALDKAIKLHVSLFYADELLERITGLMLILSISIPNEREVLTQKYGDTLYSILSRSLKTDKALTWIDTGVLEVLSHISGYYGRKGHESMHKWYRLLIQIDMLDTKDGALAYLVHTLGTRTKADLILVTRYVRNKCNSAEFSKLLGLTYKALSWEYVVTPITFAKPVKLGDYHMIEPAKGLNCANYPVAI